jgi:hypothetical protein
MEFLNVDALGFPHLRRCGLGRRRVYEREDWVGRLYSYVNILRGAESQRIDEDEPKI